MNPTTDLDRLLTEWLDEGPKQAPERPIQLAVEHARAHPRRPDPIWFVRADAMAPRTFQLAFQPAFALLAVGLLLAAIVAVGVGSRGNEVVPPVPSATPSLPPSSGPSPTPTPPTLKFNETITFTDTEGIEVRVTVYELSGLLEAAAHDATQDIEIPDGESVGLANDTTDPNVLRVAWGGCPSQTDYLVTVDPIAGTLVIETPPCEGDTLGVGRGLALRFSEPVPAADIEATLVEKSAGDPGG